MKAQGRVPVTLFLTLWGTVLAGALGTPSVAQSPTATPPEISSHETLPSFKLQVERKLVVVRVVVRNSRGEAVGNLRKEDFLVFDDGKPQTISHFSVESRSAALGARTQANPPNAEDAARGDTTAVASTPQRFVALYFDDIHLPFEDIPRTREAADRYLKSSEQPGDRLGLFTSSGQNQVDFTSDAARIHEALFQLHERPLVLKEGNPCPDLSDYQAYLIVHEREPDAFTETAVELLHCRYSDDQRFMQRAQGDAEDAAYRVLSLSESTAAASLRGIDGLVRRMASLPGQRAIIVVSPGFLTETSRPQIYQIIDRALRSNIVLSGIDSRGLYAPVPGGDIDKRPVLTLTRVDLIGKKEQFEIQRRTIATDALSQMATATGGTFFHNSNDLDLGFRKAGGLPEAYYSLAFSPQQLKLDGRFHVLKVRLAEPAGLTVQARGGYFAPRQSPDVATQEKEDIEQALFSQDEVSELPVEVHTEFFKPDGSSAKLSVLTRLDAHLLRFHKAEGRNLSKVTFVTALFDRDGKLLDGREKAVEFHLRDTTLERLLQSGIAVKASFDVSPGTYLVREVVREAEGGQISGLNRTVEIP
jgi:VWFA-related protein